MVSDIGWSIGRCGQRIVEPRSRLRVASWRGEPFSPVDVTDGEGIDDGWT